MIKLRYGSKGQVSFKNQSEYYYALGFLADSRRADLRWEHNEDQGAWGSEGRIHCLIPTSEFPAFFSFTAGRGNIYARINCNEYVGKLIMEHSFSYNGEKNNFEKIKKTVPEQYLQVFMDGYKNLESKSIQKKSAHTSNVNITDAKEKQQKLPKIEVKIGDSVRHKDGYLGKVIGLEERYIKIDFDDRQLKFQFPNAFIDGVLNTI